VQKRLNSYVTRWCTTANHVYRFTRTMTQCYHVNDGYYVYHEYHVYDGYYEFMPDMSTEHSEYSARYAYDVYHVYQLSIYVP